MADNRLLVPALDQGVVLLSTYPRKSIYTGGFSPGRSSLATSVKISTSVGRRAESQSSGVCVRATSDQCSTEVGQAW